jgi:predicted small integral membrane protein
MFENEIFQLLKQVVTSWQVIIISIALILYLNIVFYVARAYHSPRIGKISIKKKKKDRLVVSPSESEETGDSNNELGLEEA